MNFRVGIGYDVHRLEAGRPFLLGGIEIEHHKGAVGHSDADVLIHAICDALLGAANLGDIGTHFPDTDPAFKGIDSKQLLRKVGALIRKAGFHIGNIDSTVCLQAPRLKPLIPRMRHVLAQALEAPESALSIKATTTERLGFVGREDGVSAYAVALIRQR